MYNEIQCLPYLRLDDKQYIFIGSFKDPVRKGFLDEKDLVEKSYVQIILPIESILDENYFVNENGEIEEHNPYCKRCGSINVIKKDFNWRILYLETGVPIRVKIKRYQCKDCKKKSQTEFRDYYEKYCNFSNKHENKVKRLIQKGWKSLRNIKNDFKELISLDISYETVRKYLFQDNSLYWSDNELKLSGYYGYDAQWVRIEREWVYRLVLFDTIRNKPVACQISDNESNETVKNFIEKSIPSKHRKAIVTDLKPGYDKIMHELGFVHQHCIFHLLKNIYEATQSEINKTIQDYKTELKEKHPKHKITKLAKNKKDELEKEMNEYIELFKELFNQQTFDKAINYINFLKNELKGFPKPLAKYLNKNFFPEYRKFLRFLEKPFKGKLERTNNKTENYLGNTLDKHTKRIYKTLEGIFAYIMARKNGWIENRNQDLTN